MRSRLLNQKEVYLMEAKESNKKILLILSSILVSYTLTFLENILNCCWMYFIMFHNIVMI